MTGDLDPLAAVRADAARLDALAATDSLTETDPALLLLAVLRGEIDAAVAATTTPALRRDAELLDALAAGFGLAPMTDPALGLLHALRAAVDGVTVTPAVPVVPRVVQPLVAVGEPTVDVASRRRRRILRTGVAAGSVALALSMSGVAAAAYDSHPGGSLYSLRTQTFGRTDDDPVAAEQVLSDLEKQTAVAVSAPGNTVAVAKARALATQLDHYLAAERNHPAAQRSIAASAVTVVTTVDALPAPVVVRSRKPHPVATVSAVAGRHGAGVHPGTEAGPPTGSTVAPRSPEPAAGSPAPDASPGSIATPSSASASPVPSGSPATTDSPTGTPSPSTSSTGTPDPGATPSASPSASASDSSSAIPSATSSDTPPAAPTDKASPVRTPVVVKAVKPKPKIVKKKRVTATLMTAQLPSSGLPQR